MDIAARLKSVEEFSTVGDKPLQWLAARTHIHSVRRGQKIHGGVEFVHLVLSGRLHSVCLAGSSRWMIVQDVGPMQMIGHIPVLARIDHDPLLLIQAAENCTLARITATDFRYMVKLYPQVADAVLRTVAASCVDLSKKLAELSVLPAKARLYLYVLRKTAQNPGYDVGAPTHEVIAAHIGSHREAVTREMRELERAGLLSYTRGTIRMINRPGLYSLFHRNVGNRIWAAISPVADPPQHSGPQHSGPQLSRSKLPRPKLPGAANA